MSRPKHTPGPWTCRDGGSWWSTDDWGFPYHLVKNSDCIAIAAGDEVVAFSARAFDGWDNDECDANAYLIAAAPELYDKASALAERLTELDISLPELERMLEVLVSIEGARDG